MWPRLLILLVLIGLNDQSVADTDSAVTLRHWYPGFQKTSLASAYVSIIPQPEFLQIWREVNASANSSWKRLIYQSAPDLEQRSEPQQVLDAAAIDDVFDPQQAGVLAEGRMFSRSSVSYHEGFGYTLLACVTSAYQPGQLPLIPALFFSATGKPDSWQYMGQLPGEPAAFAAEHYVWSDCGSIFRMDDGSWRIYLNGYGVHLGLLTSQTINGPWQFLRSENQQIRELAAALTRQNSSHHGFAFPTVVRINANEWHAWFSEGWPGRHIWHLYSNDGIDWKLYGAQPEITRAAVAGKPFKNIRVYWDAEASVVVGLLAVWDQMYNGEDGWVLYRSELKLTPDRAAD